MPPLDKKKQQQQQRQSLMVAVGSLAPNVAVDKNQKKNTAQLYR